MTPAYRFIKPLFLLVVALCLPFGLSGCDQVREKLAAVIKPGSAKDALDGASKSFAAGQYQQAIEQAKPFANTAGEQQQQFALVVARSYAMTGNAEQALSFLSIAAQAGPLNRPILMMDSAFAPIATDLRFVAFVADQGNAPGAPAGTATPAGAAAATVQAVAGDVSAQVGPGGASARAGDVSVRVSP